MFDFLISRLHVMQVAFLKILHVKLWVITFSAQYVTGLYTKWLIYRRINIQNVCRENRGELDKFLLNMLRLQPCCILVLHAISATH